MSKLLNIDASKLIFSGNNPKVVYAQIGTDVRRIDLGSATMSRPLASNVAEFSIYEDSTIVFTTLLNPETKKRSVGYYDAGSDKTRIVRSYTDDGTASLHFAVGEYFNENYFAISYGEKVDILKGDFSNPSAAKRVSGMSVAGGVQYFAISTDGRFVVAQQADKYTVNDLELKKVTTTQLKGSTPVTEELKWLDTYTVWSDRDGMVRLYEFDGGNQHNIMPVVPGFNVTLNQNAKYMYGINKSEDGTFHLQRVRLVL